MMNEEYCPLCRGEIQECENLAIEYGIKHHLECWYIARLNVLKMKMVSAMSVV